MPSFFLGVEDVRWFRFLSNFHTLLERTNYTINILSKNSVRMWKLQKKLSFFEEISYMRNFNFFLLFWQSNEK